MVPALRSAQPEGEDGVTIIIDQPPDGYGLNCWIQRRLGLLCAPIREALVRGESVTVTCEVRDERQPA